MTLEIYYATGDRHRARELFDRAWPEHIPDRDRFWRRLMDKYQASFLAPRIGHELERAGLIARVIENRFAATAHQRAS